MPKYNVRMIRTEYREHVFTVEADSKEDAKVEAEEQNESQDWTESPIYHGDEEISTVVELTDGETEL